jgi:large subunit ribosomal protein L7/L12
MTNMADLQKLAEEIQGLTLLEASQLVKILEEKLGVTAAAPMAMAAAMPGMAAAAAAVEEEEKTEFDVMLTEVGAKKIQVIKVVRQLTNLGLKESKDLVDGAPSTVLQAVSKEVAEDAKVKLEAEGATVQVK